jgi:hypothetical protein
VVAAGAVLLASVGYAASLLLQEQLVALTPPGVRGHALGLHSSGMLTAQGLGAALAGAVAGRTSVPTAMAVSAGLSVAVTLALAPGLGRARRAAQRPEGAEAPERGAGTGAAEAREQERGHPGAAPEAGSAAPAE